MKCKCGSENYYIQKELEYNDGSGEPTMGNFLIWVEYYICNDCGYELPNLNINKMQTRTFVEFLIDKGIPFDNSENEGLWVDDEKLQPFEAEIKNEFPEFKLHKELSRYNAAPIHASE